MSDKFVYQNARIKSKEGGLMTAQSVQRLIECPSLAAAFRTLADLGFGGGAVDSEDFDALFEAEEGRIVSLFKEFNVDGALDVFLIAYDILDLKILLKAKYSSKPYPELKTVGLFSVEQLVELVEAEEPERISADIAPMLYRLRALDAEGKLSARLIDAEMDRAQYAYIFSHIKKNDALMRDYFVMKVDLADLLALLRCRRLALDASFLEEMLIDGGSLKGLKDIYGADDKLREVVKNTPYGEIVCKVLDGGSVAAYETAMDNMLLKYWKDRKNEMFEASPIVAYCLARATELKVAKLIVAGIKNGVAAEIIRERLRELYA